MRIRDIGQEMPTFRYHADIPCELNRDAGIFILLTRVAPNG
jgi:hypothetical protein